VEAKDILVLPQSLHKVWLLGFTQKPLTWMKGYGFFSWLHKVALVLGIQACYPISAGWVW